MVGDVLLISKKHERVARELLAKIKDMKFEKLSVAIGGESGSGKSEIAETLRKVLKEAEFKSKIISLDNYYKIPPNIRNDYRKKNGVASVGINEIDWEILNENIQAFKQGTTTTMPYLDLFTNQEDKLVTNFSDISVLIVEGLYACYSDVDIKVFIDLTYHETKKAQIKRHKEKYDKERLKVLEKEHQEVVSLRALSNYLVTPTFHLVDQKHKFSPLEDEKNDRMLFLSANLPLKVQKNVKDNKYDVIYSYSRREEIINSVYSSYNSLWFGHIEGSDLTRRKIKSICAKKKFVNVPFDKNASATSCKMFCEKTLLPLFHYFIETTEYNADWWHNYVQHNYAYYLSIKESLSPNDVVWIHDYQLMLLPALIRHDFPDIHIGFFLYSAFPSFEVFRLLPWGKQLLEGILGADLIGLRSYDYVRHLQSSLYRILGLESKLGSVLVDNRPVQLNSYSVGVDLLKIKMFKKKKKLQDSIYKNLETKGDKKIILSFENLESNLNLIKKIHFIDHFFSYQPGFKEKLVFQIVLENTSSEKERKIEKRKFLKLVKECNKKYKTKNWQPLVIIDGLPSDEELFVLYNSVDILLIDSMNDDVNLIIKEYVAARLNKKVQILVSEFLSGSVDLPKVTFLNANDEKEFSKIIVDSLETETTEKEYLEMLNWVEHHTALGWAVDFFEDLKAIKIKQAQVKTHRFSVQIQTKILTDYYTRKKRLIIFDYNGTLTPLRKNVNTPPSKDVISLLKNLGSDKKNKIVIISDTNKEYLEKWFSGVPVDLMACSDVAVKTQGEDWLVTERVSNEWKKEVMPILEKYNDRSPGAFIEEKGYSLTWHFDKVTKELGEIRSRELMDELLSFTEKDSLQVHEGERLIEIKNAGLYKGKSLQLYFDIDKWDFIWAAGDDWTNETMFEHLPSNAYTVKVGMSATNAKYTVKHQEDIIEFWKSVVNYKG